MSFTTIAENLRAHGFNVMDVCQTLARLGAHVSAKEDKLVIDTPGSRDVVLWH